MQQPRRYRTNYRQNRTPLAGAADPVVPPLETVARRLAASKPAPWTDHRSPARKRRKPPFLPTAINPAVRPSIFLTLAFEPALPVTMALDMSIPQSIELTRGEDRVLQAKMDRPRDIADWTVEFVVATRPAGTVALRYSTASPPGGIAKTNSARGIIEIALSADDSLALAENAALSDDDGYVWHLKRTDPGYQKVLATGELIVNERVAA